MFIGLLKQKKLRSSLAMEVTESEKVKYTYPFGLGSFLMSGCYQANNLMSTDSMNGDVGGSSDNGVSQDGSGYRRRRETSDKEPIDSLETKKKSENFMNFCGRYAQLEPTRECFVNYKTIQCLVKL
jgi:hypothetical protein